MSFSPTNLAQSLTGNNSKKRINIKFVFKYKYKNQNNSPAIILEDRIGNSLSSFPHEYDVFLFPFTFARINNIKSDEQNINN